MKKTPTGLSVHVPADFYPSQFPTLRALENEACWFLDYILAKISLMRWREREAVTQVEFSRKTMRRFIHPGNVDTIIRALVLGGVVTRDEHYMPKVFARDGKGKCMAYGIHPDFSGPTRIVEITSRTLAAKMRKRRVVIKDVPLAPEHTSKVNQLLLATLGTAAIDMNPAAAVSDPLDRIMAEKFNDKSLIEFAEDEYGRRHNLFTRMRRFVREKVRISGRLLASIDLASSQLIFLVVMLRKAGIQAAEFENDVQAGRIYEKLMVESGYQDRDEFKTEFFRAVLGGDPSKPYSKNSAVRLAFDQCYPVVSRFITSQKQWSRGKGKRSDAFRQFSRELQRRESAFIFDGVCARIAASNPKCNPLTVHDAVWVEPHYVQNVTNIMDDEFKKLGIQGRYKITLPWEREPTSAMREAA